MIDPPSRQTFGNYEFFLKQKILGFKELEMDSGALKMAIMHVRVLNHKERKILSTKWDFNSR